MAEPTWSYMLWFTQRVGSTLLAQALDDTGAAGRPREWLEAPSIDELLARHRARDAAALRDALWHAGTANHVLGVKYGMTAERHRALTALLRELVEPDAPEPVVWAALFPACRHIHITRRDRLRLAISWWRAIQSGEWHRPLRSDTAFGPAGPPASSAVEDRYDADAIDHLLDEVHAREAAIHDTFARWSVTPMTIFYEDLVTAYEGTVRTVLRFLDVPDAIRVPEPAFARLADETSERWYARYVAERGVPQG